MVFVSQIRSRLKVTMQGIKAVASMERSKGKSNVDAHKTKGTEKGKPEQIVQQCVGNKHS